MNILAIANFFFFKASPTACMRSVQSTPHGIRALGALVKADIVVGYCKRCVARKIREDIGLRSCIHTKVKCGHFAKLQMRSKGKEGR